jgi:tetratricopeptide (TPR) repeat protein
VYEALKKAQAQRHDPKQRKAYTRQQDEASFKAVFAEFLLVVGRSEDAERRARPIVEDPDRAGHTSTNKRQLELRNRLILWLALRMRAEELREEDAAGAWLSRTSPNRRAVALEAEAWAERCRILRILEDESFLLGNLRPYLSGNASPWMAATLVQLLPPGAAFEAVRLARAEEEDPRAAPYFDALEAEASLRLSRHEDAVRLARRALEGLPAEGEKLLRARVSAVASEALRRAGNESESRGMLRSALADFPSVTRMLDLAIPVRIEDDGSDAARRLAEAIARSPRFRRDPEGRPVRVWTEGAQLRFAMEGHFEPDGSPDGTVTAALRRFHQRVMSPRVDLTPIQINSLDGLQTAGGGGADRLVGENR